MGGRFSRFSKGEERWETGGGLILTVHVNNSVLEWINKQLTRRQEEDLKKARLIEKKREEEKRKIAILYQEAELERLAVLRRKEKQEEMDRALAERLMREEEERLALEAPPRPALVATIRKSRVRCPQCLFHHGLSCSQFQEFVGDLEIHESFDEEKWSRCLFCGLAVKHGLACTHVSCRCGHEFCTTCGWDWPM